MSTIYQTWSELRALFERRELSDAAVDSLHQEEYILHPGAAQLPSLRLDDHAHRHATPWRKAGGRPQYEGLDGAITGYVIDGDLTIDGAIINGDHGAPALIVLGDLRAQSIVLSGDAKLIVLGKLVTDLFFGAFPDGYLVVQGDLDARAAIFWDEFSPGIIGGSLRAHVFSPPYYDPATDDKIKQYLPISPDPDPAALFVPEVQVPRESENRTLARFGLSASKIFERLERAQPVLR